MPGSGAERVVCRIDSAASRACRTLLRLERFRRSHDPAERALYREVHDLVGDLGSLRLEIETIRLGAAGDAAGPDLRG